MAFAPTTITNSYDLSRDGSLSIGGAVLEGFKSGSISFSGDSVDNSTRDDDGWGRNVPTKRSATLSVTCNKISGAGNGCQSGLRGLMIDDDWQTKGVDVVYTSATSGTSGFKGVFVMTSYSESQAADGEAVEISMEFQSFGAITANS